MNKLIAFTGLAGAGKTTAAKILTGALFGYSRFSFADPLRAMLKAIDVTPDARVKDWKETAHPALCGKTPRHALQTLGTEWGRQMIGETIWIEAARRRIRAMRPWPVVFDDCRFDNEGAMIWDMGGKVIEIVRPGLPRMDHSSEAGITLKDATITNDGSEPEFLHKVVNCIRQLG